DGIYRLASAPDAMRWDRMAHSYIALFLACQDFFYALQRLTDARIAPFAAALYHQPVLEEGPGDVSEPHVCDDRPIGTCCENAFHANAQEQDTGQFGRANDCEESQRPARLSENSERHPQA